jgi:hypothetical protein
MRLHQVPKLSTVEERLVKIGVMPIVKYDEYGVQVFYLVPAVDSFEPSEKARATIAGITAGEHSYREVLKLLPTPEEVADSQRRAQNIRIYKSLPSDKVTLFADPAEVTTAEEWWKSVKDEHRAEWVIEAQKDRLAHAKGKKKP